MIRMTLRRAAPLTLAALALALAACGGDSTDTPATPAAGAAAGDTLPPLPRDQQVKISFSSYNLSSDDLGAPVIRRLVQEFEAAHPNVSVELRGAEQTEYVAAVRRQAATGDAPDLAQMIFSDLAFSKQSLGAQPLEQLVGREELSRALGGEHPFQDRAARLGTIDGATYALPFVFSTPVLYYNADLLRAAGLDPDAPPRTWDAAERDALTVQSRTGKQGLGLMCLDLTIQTDWCLQGILFSDGADVMNADASQITWDSPAAVGALRRMQELVDSGAATRLGGADQVDAFARGELAMMLSTSAVQGSLLRGAGGHFRIRAAAMPRFGQRPAAPTNSGGGLVILAGDPLKQRAAWELMKWLTSDRAQTAISEGIGYLPSRTSLVDDPAYLKPWARQQQGLLEPNVAQLAQLTPWRSFPGTRYKEIQQTLMDATMDVVFHGADAGQALSEAKSHAQELMPDA